MILTNHTNEELSAMIAQATKEMAARKDKMVEIQIKSFRTGAVVESVKVVKGGDLERKYLIAKHLLENGYHRYEILNWIREAGYPTSVRFFNTIANLIHSEHLIKVVSTALRVERADLIKSLNAI